MSEEHADEVIEELREIARIRTRANFDRRSFPHVDELLGSPESTEEFTDRLHHRVVGAFGDGDRRAVALGHIYSTGADRWRPLKDRYADAGRVFKKSGSWVRASYQGTTPFEEWLSIAATHMTEDPNQNPAPATDHPSATAPTRTSSRRPVHRVVLSAAVGVGFALVAWQLLERSETSAERTETSAPAETTQNPAAASGLEREVPTIAVCDVIGVIASPGLGDKERSRLRLSEAEFRALIEATECPSGPVTTYVDALVLELVVDEKRSAVIVQAPDQTVPTRLTWTQWSTYLEIQGRTRRENAADFGGYPVRIETMNGSSVVTLDGGGVLIGSDAQQPHFWVPPIGGALEEWMTLGGVDGELGRPTSNPYQLGDGTFRQDYTLGYMTSDQLAPPPTVVIVDDLTEDLERLEPIENRILRQAGGQSWFVDEERVRHWIPTGEVWACLGGQDAAFTADVPGYAISSLAMGQPATCDLVPR